MNSKTMPFRIAMDYFNDQEHWFIVSGFSCLVVCLLNCLPIGILSV